MRLLTATPSILSRSPERVSGGRVLRPLGRPSSAEPCNRFNQLGTGRSTRSDIYARPDVYDMEYEGASNHDARFFARLLARVRPRRVLELACGSGRVTFTVAAALPMAEIVGVDSSIDMLGKAATARDAAAPLVRERVSFMEGDMRDWPGTGDAIDAVVIACCSVSQYADYHFVRVDRTSPYVVTVARRPRRSGRRPFLAQGSPMGEAPRRRLKSCV